MGAMRFRIRYGSLRLLLSVLGLGPRWSRVVVGDREIEVVMGWAFRATIPRASIRSARRGADAAASIGVHGFGGSWLVNGALGGIVELTIDPPAHAVVIGFYPTRVGTLRIGLEDPAAFVSALT